MRLFKSVLQNIHFTVSEDESRSISNKELSRIFPRIYTKFVSISVEQGILVVNCPKKIRRVIEFFVPKLLRHFSCDEVKWLNQK